MGRGPLLVLQVAVDTHLDGVVDHGAIPARPLIFYCGGFLGFRLASTYHWRPGNLSAFWLYSGRDE